MKRWLLGVRIGVLACALPGGMSLTGCGGNGLRPEPAPAGSSAVQAEVRALLARQITFHAEAEHFFDVLGRLSQASSLNIVVSQALLRSPFPDAPADAEVWRSVFELTALQRAFHCVTIHARQKAVADVLDALCMQLDLRWVYPDPAAPLEERFGFIYLYPGWAEDDD